ncbi:MAG: tRNA (guanosine(46)-N7)-methyltransferase TrmB [Eubacterium sp.]|nr:tRNA (guanosine(46)-N7)-methyltransferase TrmB [Eubacterium sp.]
MRLRNVKGSRETIAANEFALKNPEQYKGKWSEVFEQNLPIHIEIGMGKGQFLMKMAELHPDIHYIGIEKYSSVLVRALEKIEENPLPNIHFIRMDAENITQVFEKGEVEQIYLNFSDPWPKDRHAKRRLTSRQFLERYDNILKDNGKIIFKTDNRALFDFSLEEVKEAGWSVELCTFDLHHSEYLEGNVMTEYEEKFVKKGNPICKMVIHHEK